GGIQRGECEPLRRRDIAVPGKDVGEDPEVVLIAETAGRILRHLLRDRLVEIAEVMMAVAPASREADACERNSCRALEIRSVANGAGLPIHRAAPRDLSVGEA